MQLLSVRDGCDLKSTMCIFSVVFYFACVWVSFSASRTDALAADHFNNGSAASFVAKLSVPQDFCLDFFFKGDVPGARSLAISKDEGLLYVSTRDSAIGKVSSTVLLHYRSSCRTHAWN